MNGAIFLHREFTRERKRTRDALYTQGNIVVIKKDFQFNINNLVVQNVEL